MPINEGRAGGLQAFLTLCVVSVLSLASLAGRADAEPNPEAPTASSEAAFEDLTRSPYAPSATVQGDLISIGSDTFANLISLWAEAFRQRHPGVTIQVQAPGSSTAPTALSEGTANLGPMSRRMKSSELEEFERRYGYRPTGVRVAIDALAVYVHKDNPLQSLELDEVDAMFSATRRCGRARGITRWGDLGLDGSWQRRPVALFGRNSVSGTYGYFKQVALCSGDFLSSVSEQPGSASVVQAIGSTLGGIGFSGIGYATSSVRPLAIADDDDEPVFPTPDTARDGSYPLTRYLYVYVNRPPVSDTEPSVRVRTEVEFLRFVLSREGQAIVSKDGYVPLPARIAERERQRLDR